MKLLLVSNFGDDYLFVNRRTPKLPSNLSGIRICWHKVLIRFLFNFQSQSPLRSYPIEAIGPISCTMDGVYLAGGAPSGNVYIWAVANGRLLKTWRAHHKSLKCMAFSNDDSVLISGSDDGMICVWSMVSLLDMENLESSPSLLHYSSEHRSSISGLLTTSSANSTFISSSLDGTCKAWDLVSGRLIQTQEHPLGITAIVLHPAERFLLGGSIDGRIFVSVLNIGLVDDPFVVAEDQLFVLEGHKGSITALAFSTLGLISASEDGNLICHDRSEPSSLGRCRRAGCATFISSPPVCRLYTTAGAAQPQLDPDYYYYNDNSNYRERSRNRLAKAPMADSESSVPRRGVHWAFIGYPRIKKRMYVERLSELLEVPYISMASLVRQELNPGTSLYKQGSLWIVLLMIFACKESSSPYFVLSRNPTDTKIANAVNRGKLVPEDIIFGLLSKRLEDGYYRGETGFILDGIPRSKLQAEILDELAKIDLVVNFKCTDDFLIKNQEGSISVLCYELCELDNSCGTSPDITSHQSQLKYSTIIAEGAWKDKLQAYIEQKFSGAQTSVLWSMPLLP
ncbi:hypothetical protein GH714_023997 [Hevea brasiliensis]|uniref:adenylate kinase n=1 Tax=Hevea brasiliensis TaxID=3981 RepID=A0A6A6MNT5_HEVBR|nr:hypothetical protein GH714_023997 [Hevea brasiliensis]